MEQMLKNTLSRTCLAVLAVMVMATCGKSNTRDQRWTSINAQAVQGAFNISTGLVPSVADSTYEMMIKPAEAGLFEGDISFRIEHTNSVAGQTAPLSFSGQAGNYQGDGAFANGQFKYSYVQMGNVDTAVVVTGSCVKDTCDAAVELRHYQPGSTQHAKFPLGQVRFVKEDL